MKQIIKALYLVYRYPAILLVPAFTFSSLGKLLKGSTHDISAGWKNFLVRILFSLSIWSFGSMCCIIEEKRQKKWQREGGTIINKDMWYIIGFGLIVAGFLYLFGIL